MSKRTAKKKAAAKQTAVKAKTTEKRAAAAVQNAAKEAAAEKRAGKDESDRIFQERLARHHDELRWLYMELYGNDDMFAELCSQMKEYYDQRNESLRALDAKRESE